SMLRFIAYVDLSVLYITQAHVRQAEALVDTFINHCHAHAIEPPILGGILLNSAMIAYEYNQLADANAHITKAIQLIKRGGVENALVFAYAYRFFVASAQEKWSVAHDALTHYENIIRKWDAATLYDNNLLAYRIDLETRRGNHARALSMLQEATITPADTIHTQKASLYLALLRALIASRHLDDAQIVCEKLLSMSKQQGTQRDIPYLNMRYAIIKYLQNEHDTARDYLKLALSDAQLYGLVQSIISPPHETQALLRLAQKHNIAPDYVSSLLTHITPQQAPKTLASPLTKRELQILRLLHDGKTNQEIASELVIALSTTKRHIMNIYAKLDVHNRTHAVLRGNQLGLIE
ncbi:MAG: LuxR C-terminal-related transcriptional regulator, partial [Chloroflexota bacterium]